MDIDGIAFQGMFVYLLKRQLHIDAWQAVPLLHEASMNDT